MMRDLLELRLDPAGTDAHDMDALRTQLTAERAGKAQNIALARAIHRLIRHRLPGGVRAHVDDIAAGMHIRQARVAHARECERVELRARDELLAVRLGKRAEHAAAGGVDQHADLGLLLLEQRLIGVDAAQIREIERDRPDGIAALAAQLLKPLFSAGDDPDLVIFRVLVHSVDELTADAGGCAGDDSNVHSFSSVFQYRCIYHTAFAPVAQACAGKKRCSRRKKSGGRVHFAPQSGLSVSRRAFWHGNPRRCAPSMLHPAAHCSARRTLPRSAPHS